MSVAATSKKRRLARARTARRRVDALKRLTCSPGLLGPVGAVAAAPFLLCGSRQTEPGPRDAPPVRNSRSPLLGSRAFCHFHRMNRRESTPAASADSELDSHTATRGRSGRSAVPGLGEASLRGGIWEPVLPGSEPIEMPVVAPTRPTGRSTVRRTSWSPR